MTILPLIAASFLSPTTPTVSDTVPAWLSPPALLATEAVIDPRVIAEQHYEHNSHQSAGFYIRATGGITTTSKSDGPGEEIDFDEGYLLSLGLGHRFGASANGLGFAVELDGVWTDQDADTDDGSVIREVTVAGALLNGLLDYRFADRLSLYAGAGVGLAWLDVGTISDDLNDFEDEDGPFLAWQGRAGLAWSFTERLSLHLGYRFLNIDDAEIDESNGETSFDLETQQHVLEAGLLFGF